MVTFKLVERSCNFQGLNLMVFINFGHISVIFLSKFLFIIEMQ